jgi:hypothetical protein
VIAPWPGPISTTASEADAFIDAKIASMTRPSIKKFWPNRLRADFASSLDTFVPAKREECT